MTGSSQGGAEAVPSENQLDRLLLFVKAEGGARAPGAPCWIRHCQPRFTLYLADLITLYLDFLQTSAAWFILIFS